MKNESVRVIDGGGNGFRRSDVKDGVPGPVTEKKVGSLDELLNFVCDYLPKNLLGVSYATAGIIEDKNVVVSSPNIKWLSGVRLAEETTTATGKPSIVCNDMEAAVVGMTVLVPEIRAKSFIGITVSSGIGARLVNKYGQIIFQDTEAGHICIDNSPHAPLCGCGVRGCVEAIAGGEAVRRRVLNETEALCIKIPPGVHPCAFLDDEWDRSASWAAEIYRIISGGLGDLLAILQTVSHSDAIVWKGTLAEKVIPRIDHNIKSRMMSRLINPDWAKMDFYMSPRVNGIENSDSFVGGAKLFLDSKIQ